VTRLTHAKDNIRLQCFGAQDLDLVGRTCFVTSPDLAAIALAAIALAAIALAAHHSVANFSVLTGDFCSHRGRGGFTNFAKLAFLTNFEVVSVYGCLYVNNHPIYVC